MKILLSLKLWLAVCLFAVSTASMAGTIWTATESSVNFSSFTGLDFGLFKEDTNLSSIAAGDLLAESKTLLGFSVLSASVFEPFKVAVKFGSSWVSDITTLDLGDDSWLLIFSDPAKKVGGAAFLAGFDIAPADSAPGAVPLPASVWMMTSALMGFLYIGRRKQVV